MKRLFLASLIALCALPPFGRAANAPSQEAPVQSPPAPPAGVQKTPELAEADKLNDSVKQLYAARKYKEALPHAQRELALREEVLKDDDPSVGGALHNLAILYIALGDAGKAEPLCERILSRREAGRAPTSASTMRIITAYGCILSAKGKGKYTDPSKLTARVSKILLEDAIHAAGLTPPGNLDDLGGKRLKSEPPRYPGEAKSRGLQGTVFVLIDVDETGRVVSAEPLPCGAGMSPLADASVEAARLSSFAPILVAGRPIHRKQLVKYSFVLLR